MFVCLSVALCLSSPAFGEDAPAVASGEAAAAVETAPAPSAENAELAIAKELSGLRNERTTLLKTLRDSSQKMMKARSESEKTNPELAAKLAEIQEMEKKVRELRESYREFAEALPELKEIKAEVDAATARMREIDARIRELAPDSNVRPTQQQPRPPRTFERPRPSQKKAAQTPAPSQDTAPAPAAE